MGNAMRIVSFVLFLMPFLILANCQAEGIQIGRTRVIYNAESKETALSVVNSERELPWLVQSWTDTGDGKTRGPFIVTPPLFRLDPQKEQSLRITWNGVHLPEDRESLFYMNVRTIPAIAKDNKQINTLRLIYKTRIKLFWRPEGLSGSPEETCEHLKFVLAGNQLHIINDGLFYSVFDTLYLGNNLIKKADMIAPKSTISLPVNAEFTGKDVSWRCITDYGNASAKHSSIIKQE
ncbi:molecular chaperone [Atlantibacter sp.]|uniref:fimbrial biogenesis chaperone n=1 Tax=Atlantibacter sp. TaxID=1903473 RepID=UPI0028B1154E|nr:molecular chaperone [Atlantibacter sp.]